MPDGPDDEAKRGGSFQLPTVIPAQFVLSVTERACGYTPVCMTFLRWSTGVSHGQVAMRRRSPPAHDRGGARFLQMKQTSIAVWLLALSSMYLIAPDSDHTYLPFSSKAVVYALYQLDVDEETGVLPCTESYFIRIWREHPLLKLIKIHKWSKFTHCDDCEEFRTDKVEAGRDRSQLVVIRHNEALHHRMVSSERGFYAARIQQAKTVRDLVLSINIDAADQAAYGYPYFHRQSKAQGSCTKFKSHLMAAIVHGRATYAWTFCDNIKHGNNLTVECLHQILQDQAAKNDGKLPRQLFLQMDNTAKQCKGKIYHIYVYIDAYIYMYKLHIYFSIYVGQYVMAFLAVLVYIGVFDTVEVNFFAVGHTHSVSLITLYPLFVTCYLYTRAHIHTHIHTHSLVFIVCMTGRGSEFRMSGHVLAFSR
jgi:hypothetical protein